MPVESPRKRSTRPSRPAANTTDRLPPVVRLRHKPSGKERRIGTGFAWDLFLFAGVFGLPLFRRNLPYWGAVVLVLWLLVLVVGAMPLDITTEGLAQLALSAVFFLVQLYLGFRGNRINVRTLLAHGWVIDQNDGATKRLIERWRLA